MRRSPKSYTKIECLLCGKEHMARNDSIKKGMGKFCSKKCGTLYHHKIGTPRNFPKGKDHHWWKGGEFIDEFGYVQVYLPGHRLAFSNGYVLKHRLVAEEKFGKPLGKYQVHHIDRDKTNNHPDNLHICTRSEHLRLHRKEDSESYHNRSVADSSSGSKQKTEALGGKS